MWSPTHVQVTVQRAKDLLIKGKNDTNNPFVTIAIGKEKYQTSIKEKEGKDVQWHEQCELLIPHIGNTASIVLTALHRNTLGIDEFLGYVSIPLASFDVYERPKSRWYKLEGKPGKEKGKDKYRGELEVRVGFTVKASTGSLMDLSKKEKHKSSLGHLSSMVSGSLLSLSSGEKKAGIKQIAKSITKKVSRKKRDSNGGDGASDAGSKESLSNSPFSSVRSTHSNVDPGVISEDEDEFTFDNLSHKSSGNSINASNSALENLAGGEFLRRSHKGPAKPPRILSTPEKVTDEWTQKLFAKGDTLKHSIPDSSKLKLPEPNLNPLVQTEEKTSNLQNSFSKTIKQNEKQNDDVLNHVNKPPVPERKSLTSSFLEKQVSAEPESKDVTKLVKSFQPSQLKKKDKKSMDRYVVGEEVVKVTEERSKHPKDVLRQFESKSRDDLIDMVIELQKDISRSNHQLKELEDYLDQLLLKVMETTPKILQNPYISCKSQANYNYR